MESGKRGVVRESGAGRRAALCAAALMAVDLLIAGCGPSSVPSSHPAPPKVPEKTASTASLSFTNTPPAEGQQPMLANAQFTFAVQADGLPAEPAQVAFVGDISNDHEEKMVWQTLKGIRPHFTFSGISLTPEAGSDYQQGINRDNGAIVTSWTQNGVGKIRITTMGRGLHFTSELSLTPETKGELTAEPMSMADTGQSPGIRYTGMTFRFTPDLTFTKSLPCEPGVPVDLRLDAKYTHKGTEPTNPRTPHLTLDGPAEDQEAINSLAFQVTGYSQGLGPFGLTNNRYFGHVFWDADAWVFPALALLDPEKAQNIPAYRIRTRRGAEDNFAAWLKVGRPIGNDEKMLGSEHAKSGLKYAWESAESGRETAPGESKFQEHIGGTIVHGLEMASALALADAKEVRSIGEGVTRYYESRMEVGKGGLEMRDVMSPDEYHVGDNDLYTNMLAQWLLDRYTSGGLRPRVYLPRDSRGGFLTYDGDQMKSYQQAAALLTIFPLQNPAAENEAMTMLDQFGPKVIENGPAMSHSLHALIRARFGDADEAYREWRTTYDRYAQPPFGYISERPTTHQTVFITGAAGLLNTVLYGFLGIRVGEKPWAGADWKMELRNGWWISGRANLPSKWTSLTVDELWILGNSYRVVATKSGSSIELNPDRHHP